MERTPYQIKEMKRLARMIAHNSERLISILDSTPHAEVSGDTDMLLGQASLLNANANGRDF